MCRVERKDPLKNWNRSKTLGGGGSFSKHPEKCWGKGPNLARMKDRTFREIRENSPCSYAKHCTWGVLVPENNAVNINRGEGDRPCREVRAGKTCGNCNFIPIRTNTLIGCSRQND